MIIYTNEGNPFGLQMLILAKLCKQDVTVKRVNLIDADNLLMLPTMQLENGVQLFSTAACAKYLLPNEDLQSKEWLEWCSTQLAPALAHYMGMGHHADANALPILNGLVKKLDENLKSKPYLTGDQIKAGDIAVWSVLAPDGTLKNAQNVDNLRLWHKKISELPEVQSALDEPTLKDLSFHALENANRFGGFQHIPLKILNKTMEAGKLIGEQSVNLADTISEDELKAAKAAFIYRPEEERKEARTVLPKAGERNILVTSALPYVNNVPHLGNIIGCVLSADIFARYARSAGYNTLYISGTDEYGTATENKALQENLTPRQICDKYFELHNAIYRWFGIGFDYFGRTTAQEQTDIVQAAFKDVYTAGYILTESVEQLLCQKCNRFLADRFVEGTCPHPGCGYEDARGDQCDKCGKLVNATELVRPRCKVCNTAPVVRSSNQLFIDLPKIEPKLRAWLETVDSGWTHNARVITAAWVREGLKPRCITRDLKWGIPVPHKGFEKKVFYVWFDAPFGYVSMTKHYTKDYLQWWQPADGTKVELFQFMAKDNIPFHSVVWPSILLAIDKGNTLVSHIMATEYLNYEDGKFSKSRGIGVFGNDAQETGIPADVWRFYLASARPEGQDSSFSWNDLAARNNSELLNNLGNFVNRALVFCENNFEGMIPNMRLTHDELVLLTLINRELRSYMNAMEKAKLRDGIRHLLGISRHGNGYMQAQQPWVLLKGDEEQKKRAATIIGVAVNIACLLANLLFPYMPNTARILFNQLNTKKTLLNPEKPLTAILLPSRHKIGKPAPLFAKLEQAFIDELKKKYSGTQTLAENVHKSATSVEDLEKAVQAQALKVCDLKASTKDKTIWQPEVNILLDLKKQLEAAQQCAATTKPTKETVGSSSQNGIESAQELENAIQAQGQKVHELKASSKSKTVWQPEVDKLLYLKKKLDLLRKNPPSAVSAVSAVTANTPTIEELEAKIAAQGEKVRQLKSAGDASVWKPAVETLLALKKELSGLTGVAAPTPQGKQNKKK